MRMQIDEPRCDQPAGRAQDLECTFGGNVRLDRFDHAVADADVAHAPQPLARIEDVAALDQQVELVARRHRRANGRSKRTRGACGAQGQQEAAAVDRRVHRVSSLVCSDPGRES